MALRPGDGGTAVLRADGLLVGLGELATLHISRLPSLVGDGDDSGDGGDGDGDDLAEEDRRLATDGLPEDLIQGGVEV